LTPDRTLELVPEEIIARLRTAGLRQKEGAGRLLAERWQAVREADGASPLVVCNAVDGDLRAPIARFVFAHKMESMLHGLLAAAHAVGATDAVVCVNAEYGEEIAALEGAAEQLAQVRVVAIPTSLVVAEETALIRVLEGRQPLPFLRADRDVRGVDGAPTLVESAETLASVSALLGGEAGVGEVTGKVVTVFGDVAEPCTLEVPPGTHIAAAVELATRTSPAELDIKAVQFGGPATRFLVGKGLETLIAHNELGRAGLEMGSGSIEVFSGRRCAVEMARDTTARLHEESCGKCVFCREGTRQLRDMLDAVVEFRAGAEQMDLLLELAQAMKSGSICSIGWGAAAPTLSALELFADDFQSHLVGKRCPEKDASAGAGAGA
jgi:NADH-quinone oxidoreductase subunit F